MSTPQRWLDRRPQWVLPTFAALAAAGAFIATQDYARLMKSGAIWPALGSRRRDLAASYTGIAQIDEILLTTNAALSLAACPPPSVPSNDVDKLIAWTTDFFGSIPAVIALIAATSNSNAYPLPSWFGTAFIGLVLFAFSEASMPAVVFLIALGTPRTAKRPDRRKNWSAFVVALLSCYVCPALVSLYPRTFGIKCNSMFWQLSGILFILYAPFMCIVESVLAPILPSLLRPQQVGWLVAGLNTTARVVALHRLGIRPQAVFALDETTLAGAATRLLQLDALVFYVTLIAWAAWITGKGRTTVAFVVYSVVLGFGTGVGLLLDTV